MTATVRLLIAMFVASAVVAAAPPPAWAQGFALRSGANINPDQFSVGGQYERGALNDRVWLQPNADFGIGNDAKLVAVNLDLVYRKSIDRRSVWTAYAGGGPAVNWYKLLGYSQTELGANVVGGLRHSSGLFTEVRAGFLESPELRFGVGYTFRPGSGSTRTPPARRRR